MLLETMALQYLVETEISPLMMLVLEDQVPLMRMDHLLILPLWMSSSKSLQHRLLDLAEQVLVEHLVEGGLDLRCDQLSRPVLDLSVDLELVPSAVE